MSEPNGWREGTQTKGEIIAERDALRAEVAKYRGMEVEDAALRTDNEGLRTEIAALKAMYEPPLTEGEAAIANDDIAVSECGFTPELLMDADAAIQRVRRERGKA